MEIFFFDDTVADGNGAGPADVELARQTGLASRR
jgi:hypothetical protein